MPEIAVAVAIVAYLAASAAGEAAAQFLVAAGAGAAALGLAAGIPAGIGYHVALYRALSARGGAEPGWWWRPTSFHARLRPDALARVRPWFLAGAAGFTLTLAGCALLLAGVLAQ